jgi:hypothetical protein
MTYYAAAAAILVLLLGFQAFDWEYGVLRAGLVLVLLAVVLLLPWLHPPRQAGPAPATGGRPAAFGATVLLTLAVGLGVCSVVYTARTGDIRLDQGQATYRSALLLRRGENPYGRGTLLDLEAFRTRQALRHQAGVGPQVGETELAEALKRFWETLDPDLRRRLLPQPGPEAPALARREVALLGYKYGPLSFLLVVPLAGLLGPASVPVLNLAAFLAWVGILWAVLRSTALPRWASVTALTAVLAIYELAWNFLYLTAADVWPLCFASLGVLALLRNRPLLLGVALGLALGSKILPAALYLPLLLRVRWAPALLGCAAVTAGLYGPFLAWDAEAFLLNVVWWPSLMEPDSTGWVYYVSPALVAVARTVLAAAILFVSWRVVRGREEYLFRALTVMNLLIVLGGAALHNNYVTWFAPWLFFALAEAVTGTKTLTGRVSFRERAVVQSTTSAPPR